MRLAMPVPPVVVDLDAVDLRDPAFHAHGDPHTVWHVMRERSPVHRQTLPDGRSFLSVTRHADVSTVLRDHTRFTSRQGTMLSVLGEVDPAGDKMMAASDPPVHTMLRAPLAKVLSAHALHAKRPVVQRIVRRLLAPLADGEPWDLAEAAAGFPMAFTGALMGLPEADWAELTRLTTMAIAPEDPSCGTDVGSGNLVTAHHELFDYFADQVHGNASRDDLIGMLNTMAVGDRAILPDEIIYNCYSLLLGANVTTPHTMAATVLAFIDNPEQYRLLRRGEATVADAVEEGLRWSSPANHFMRYTVADVELSGVRVAPGEAIVAWLGSANRDERVFRAPYRFDVRRSPNRHVAFGFGVHYCIGAPLARLALRLFFDEFVRLVERVELAGPMDHLVSNFAAGIKTMPIAAVLADKTGVDF